MTILDIAGRGTVISVRGGMLAVGDSRFCPEDVDLVIAQVPAVTVTGDALLLMAQRGIEFLVCDQRRQPASTLLPLTLPATIFARTLRLQASLAPRRARALWRQVVRAKLIHQADFARALGCADAERIARMAADVAAGDPDNREAQGARLYWPGLFGPDFRRHATDAVNGLLDFGYAVLRSLVGRNLHAAGLSRAIGFHHDNAENDGNLADDLMEPFRPAVDRVVWGLARDGRLEVGEARPVLATIGDWPVRSRGEWVRMRVAVQRACLSCREAIEGAGSRLSLPDTIGSGDDARRLAEDVGAGLL